MIWKVDLFDKIVESYRELSKFCRNLNSTKQSIYTVDAGFFVYRVFSPGKNLILFKVSGL